MENIRALREKRGWQYERWKAGILLGIEKLRKRLEHEG